jgi:hypothetical protein
LPKRGFSVKNSLSGYVLKDNEGEIEDSSRNGTPRKCAAVGQDFEYTPMGAQNLPIISASVLTGLRKATGKKSSKREFGRDHPFE